MINSISRIRLLSHEWRRILMAGLVTVALLVVLNYWFFVRPTSVAQRFVRLVLNDQFDRAASMVSIPCEMSILENSHQLTALDGSNSEIPCGKALFHILNEPHRPSRTGITDYLLCREHFQFCAIWNDEQGSHAVPVYCTSRGSDVVIDHVGIKE